MVACDDRDFPDRRPSLDTGWHRFSLHWLGGEALLFHLPSTVHDNRNRTAAVYTSFFAGGIMGHIALVRLCVWLGTTFLAYALAFGFASIADSTLLRPLQGFVETFLLRMQKGE